jgi:hypothetical protein
MKSHKNTIFWSLNFVCLFLVAARPRWVFMTNPVIEEYHWTSIPDEDFYPSISITAGAKTFEPNLQLELALCVESDGANRATKILSVT